MSAWILCTVSLSVPHRLTPKELSATRSIQKWERHLFLLFPDKGTREADSGGCGANVGERQELGAAVLGLHDF